MCSNFYDFLLCTVILYIALPVQDHRTEHRDGESEGGAGGAKGQAELGGDPAEEAPQPCAGAQGTGPIYFNITCTPTHYSVFPGA